MSIRPRGWPGAVVRADLADERVEGHPKRQVFPKSLALAPDAGATDV